jgi:hypothetical protein
MDGRPETSDLPLAYADSDINLSSRNGMSMRVKTQILLVQVITRVH